MASGQEEQGHGLFGKIKDKVKKVGHALKDELGAARKHQSHGSPAPPAGLQQQGMAPGHAGVETTPATGATYSAQDDPQLAPVMPGGGYPGQEGELAPKTAPGEQEQFGEQGTSDRVLAPVSEDMPAGGYQAAGELQQAPGLGASETAAGGDPMLAPRMPGGGFPGREGELAPKTAPGEQEQFGEQGTTDSVLAPVSRDISAEGYSGSGMGYQRAAPLAQSETGTADDPFLAPRMPASSSPFPSEGGVLAPKTAPGEQELFGQQGTNDAVLAPVSQDLPTGGYGGGRGFQQGAPLAQSGTAGEFQQGAPLAQSEVAREFQQGAPLAQSETATGDDAMLAPRMAEGGGFPSQGGVLAPRTAPGQQEQFGQQGTDDAVLAPVSDDLPTGGYGGGAGTGGDGGGMGSGQTASLAQSETATGEDAMLAPRMAEGGSPFPSEGGVLAPKTAPGEQEQFGEQGTGDAVLAPVSRDLPAGGHGEPQEAAAAATSVPSEEGDFTTGQEAAMTEAASAGLVRLKPRGAGGAGAVGLPWFRIPIPQSASSDGSGAADGVTSGQAPGADMAPPDERRGPYGVAGDSTQLQGPPQAVYGQDNAPSGDAPQGDVKHFTPRDAEYEQPASITQQVASTAGGLRDRVAGALGFYDNGAAEPQPQPQPQAGNEAPVESSDPAASTGPSITQKLTDTVTGLRDTAAVNLGFYSDPNKGGSVAATEDQQQQQPTPDSTAAGLEPGATVDEVGAKPNTWDRPSALASEAVDHNLKGEDVGQEGGAAPGGGMTDSAGAGSRPWRVSPAAVGQSGVPLDQSEATAAGADPASAPVEGETAPSQPPASPTLLQRISAPFTTVTSAAAHTLGFTEK